MGLRCKRCGSEVHVKNGFMKGLQRYRCKACGLNFTDTPPRGMPLRVKVPAVLLYLSGLSMNRTAELLGVSPLQRHGLDRAVRCSLRPETRAGRPSSPRRAGRDGALPKKRPTSSGSGRLGIVLPDGSSTGSWAVVTGPPSNDFSSA